VVRGADFWNHCTKDVADEKIIAYIVLNMQFVAMNFKNQCHLYCLTGVKNFAIG